MIASEVHDEAIIVFLDRPAERNGLVPELLHRLVEHLTSAAQARRPVILAAEGPAFCVGADLNWLASLRDPATGVAELVAVHHLAITTLVDLPVPVISAVHGAVAGGGIGLALAADYCITADDASFRAAYFRLGLTPDAGASAFLQQALGSSRTKELLLTNRSLGAQEACALGLVNEVVPPNTLLERALGFAASLEPVPSYVLLETRRLMDSVNLKNQLQLESVAIRTAARGAFFREALRAFRERHSPST